MRSLYFFPRAHWLQIRIHRSIKCPHLCFVLFVNGKIISQTKRFWPFYRVLRKMLAILVGWSVFACLSYICFKTLVFFLLFSDSWRNISLTFLWWSFSENLYRRFVALFWLSTHPDAHPLCFRLNGFSTNSFALVNLQTVTSTRCSSWWYFLLWTSCLLV